LIPLGDLPIRLDELPKDRKIIVVSRSGKRSDQGRDTLLNVGFGTVSNLAGGMNDGVSQGLPVVTEP